MAESICLPKHTTSGRRRVGVRIRHEISEQSKKASLLARSHQPIGPPLQRLPRTSQVHTQLTQDPRRSKYMVRPPMRPLKTRTMFHRRSNTSRKPSASCHSTLCLDKPLTWSHSPIRRLRRIMTRSPILVILRIEWRRNSYQIPEPEVLSSLRKSLAIPHSHILSGQREC